MPCTITFCQQAGKNKKRNQDALFNGSQVFQYILKKAEKFCENRPHFILGIADGVSSSNRSDKASKFVMSELQNLRDLSRETIIELQSKLSKELANQYYGSATTFVAAEINQHTQTVKILSVGDSRAYLISKEGKWKQITRDHSVLNELLDMYPDQKDVEFASIYNGVSSVLVADGEPFEDQIFYQEIKFEQGQSLLLCSDGLYNGLSDKVREEIWQKFTDDKDRLTCCRQMIKKQSFYDDLSIIVCDFNI